MADASGTPGPSGSSNPAPKAIASLAKKQSDVTRLGTQKLKFVPTLPARRKKEGEEKPSAAVSAADRGRGRGSDRGRGRGRGEIRGAAPRPPTVEMTASGPFAMGPALAGTSARRTAPRSNFTPIVPQGPGGSAKLGAGLTQTTAPSLAARKEKAAEKGAKEEESDAEVYSDPDEGVEIVDMDHIKQLDWMAPESLGKEKQKGKKKAVKTKVKEESDAKEVNLANAVDLSESEEEEELEDIIDDFALANDMDVDSNIRQERLYFFQFPEPFPTFVSNATAPSEPTSAKEEGGARKVTFAEDTKPPAANGVPAAGPSGSQADPDSAVKEDPKVDGVIGQLEIYESGAVKMRLGNGILLDVTAATQPSFLQQAVYVDPSNKRLCVLGEVNRRFVVTPDIDTLLSSMELAQEPAALELGEVLITMDTS
ncbi:hypothetical protein WOLCODRAFT_77085 [Wolfiporia cocos MD-104 SS10]|uniref:RNA polymerase III RPC4-domain-containing protein n=1 Tax=Wolfiporia cocos (strain MD-104) TaxID=742152 RepID=A0A2H3JRU3_WOLCO|nr:hypothetical protein WOLCODRAFT_77085 [Wolfiporia cocos MD-104 SS10]